MGEQQPRSTDELSIAAAVAGDAGEVLTLQRAAFLRDAQVYGDPFLPSLTQTLDELTAEIVAPDRVFLVARIGQRIVGSVRAHIVGRTSHIGRLMTAPDHEGRGVGGRLMVEIESRTSALADQFELGTGWLSTGNLDMYQRRGYSETSRVEVSPKMTVVTLTKPIG